MSGQFFWSSHTFQSPCFYLYDNIFNCIYYYFFENTHISLWLQHWFFIIWWNKMYFWEYGVKLTIILYIHIIFFYSFLLTLAAYKTAWQASMWRMPPHLSFGCSCYVSKHNLNKPASGMMTNKKFSNRMSEFFGFEKSVYILLLLWGRII